MKPLFVALALAACASPALAQDAFFDDFDTLDQSRWYVSDGWSNGAHQNCTWSADQVTASGGTLRVGNTGVFGTGTLSLVSGTLSSVGAAANTVTNPVSIDGNPTFGSPLDAGMLTLSGNVTLSAARTFTVQAATTISGPIGGTYTLTKDGSETLILTGTNTYGNTTVSGGTLQVGAGGTAGSAWGRSSCAGISGSTSCSIAARRRNSISARRMSRRGRCRSNW